MDENAAAASFFEGYTRALLARDAAAIADHYAVPALIEFPGEAIAVSSRHQVEEFFAAAMGQYDQVTDTVGEVHVVTATGHSLWVDVRWIHDGEPAERFIYQLVDTESGWRIAVLTPLVA